MKRYEVTITAKFPALHEQPSVDEYEAATKADAVKLARRDLERSGYDRQDGPVTLKARELS